MTVRPQTASLVILALALSAPAHAGRLCSRGRPPAVYAQAPAPAVPTPQAAVQGDCGAALAMVNAERARHGRGPLRWSASLAGYAAANAGVHQPGTSGGAGQCWAGSSDPVQAVSQWLASPPHRAILMQASTECGISRCPSGTTANAR